MDNIAITITMNEEIYKYLQRLCARYSLNESHIVQYLICQEHEQLTESLSKTRNKLEAE